MHNIVDNLVSIKKEIQSNNSTAEVVAVSKTFPLNKILPLINFGHNHYGENKIQEAVDKWSLTKEKNPNISCFTIDIGGEIEEGLSDDLYYAKKVANFLKVPLEIVSVRPETITSSLEEMIWKLDEPLADPAALNVFFISKLARDRGIKVILSGAGGDDIFSGYRRHYAANYQFLMHYFPSVLNKKIYSIS